MKAVKEALGKAGLKRHLIVQPVGYRTPECLDHNNPASKQGMTGLEEFPFGMKTRHALHKKQKQLSSSVAISA